MLSVPSLSIAEKHKCDKPTSLNTAFYTHDSSILLITNTTPAKYKTVCTNAPFQTSFVNITKFKSLQKTSLKYYKQFHQVATTGLNDMQIQIHLLPCQTVFSKVKPITRLKINSLKDSLFMC